MRWIVVLIFVIAGPPLGIALLWGLNMLLAGQLIAPTHAHLFLLGAYVFGGLPALASGLFVARHDNPDFWRVLRIGVSVGLVVAVFLAVPQSRFVLTLDAKTLSFGLLNLLLFAVFLCLVPTIVCWLVTRICDFVWRASRSTS